VALPALATLVAMFVGFAVVTGLLFVAEGALVASSVTQWLTLAVIYLFPHFLVGLGVGTRYGVAVAPPFVIAITPVVALMIAFLAFGGPVSTPFQAPLLTLGAMAVWGVAGAAGLLAGAKGLGPWLAERRNR
jgi:hypothetical protein